jgi:hypothetical protein
MGRSDLVTAVSKSGCELDNKRTKERNIVMGAARRARRGKWRRAKSTRKLQSAAKDPGEKTFVRNESPHGEEPDRLLLSALKYWEVRRDLIEERVAAIRSPATAS